MNDKRVSGRIPLNDGDVISCLDKKLIFLDAVFDKKETKSTDAIDRLVEATHRALNSENPWEEQLGKLAEHAGAESAYLVSNIRSSGNEWEILARVGSSSPKAKDLISSTILNDAIEKGTSVYISSVIGHPYESQASIIGGRVYSVACLPLCVRGKILGCIYFSTRAPSPIRKESLSLVTQLAELLLLALSADERSRFEKGSRQENRILFSENSPMAATIEKAKRLANSSLNIVIHGETGTGKELVAHTLHEQSASAAGPFVAVNCGAIPATLMESVLFGHKKGAFTGAVNDQPGKFLQANGGTLFLDEIGDLPMAAQAALLRVLQEKCVEPVGSHRLIDLNVRVISASHRKLEELVQNGSFRKDLYYRLNGATLSIPALRERGGDIPLLAHRFLANLGQAFFFTHDALAKLSAHPWPGNVRELEQVVLRAVALGSGNEINASSIDLGMFDVKPVSRESVGDLKAAQRELTQRMIQNALKVADGNRCKAATLLGISERTLYRYLTDSSDSASDISVSQ